MPFIVLPHPFVLTFLVSFFSTLFVTWLIIPRLRKVGMVGVDLNKVPAGLDGKKIKLLKETGGGGFAVVPRSGGIAMIFGFCAGMLFSLAVFPYPDIILVLAALLSATLISTIGIVEDFLHIRQFYRVILPGVAALPLMAVTAGYTKMTLPFVGAVDFGLFYSLLLVPVGVIAASNLVNLLAGFNGVEAGTGAIIGLVLFFSSYVLGRPEAALISVALAASCAAFLFFNWYPAKVFPGNSATYMIGAVIAAIAIVGNMERVAAIALAPQIAEFFLKSLGLFRAENFGKLGKGGGLSYGGPVQSISHALMKLFRPTEMQLTLMLLVIQVLFGVLAFASIWL